MKELQKLLKLAKGSLFRICVSADQEQASVNVFRIHGSWDDIYVRASTLKTALNRAIREMEKRRGK